jgi:hypothetical protein
MNVLLIISVACVVLVFIARPIYAFVAATRARR